MGKSKRLTIYEVSKLAAVSTATVSRAMNAATRQHVAPQTLEKIDALVARLSYTPHAAARHLGGSSYRTIGVVLPHRPGVFFTPYYVQVLAGIADVLLETEYQFKLVMLKMGESRWDRYDFRAGEGIDGLIVTHWPKFFSEAKVLGRLRVPCIVINDPAPHSYAYFVAGDNVMGGRLAAHHFYERGHRDLAVITGPAWSADSRLRVHGFRSYLRTRDRRLNVTVLHGDFQQETGRMLALELVREKPGVTGVFCCNDNMAVGVLNALRLARRTCPRDLSVIGYDDDPSTQTAQPPLTTVHVPLYDIAKEAARRLVRQLKGEGRAEALAGQTLLPVKLVERASVCVRR